MSPAENYPYPSAGPVSSQVYQTGDVFLDFLLNDPRAAGVRQQFMDLSGAGLNAFGAYATSPIANPVLKSVAGQGYPGFEANFAALPQSYTFKYLNDAAQYLMRNPGTVPHSGQAVQQTLGEAARQDLAPTQNRGVPQSGHTMATALYDRFFFPAVIQQMQRDPNFAPFINELLGTPPSGPWE